MTEPLPLILLTGFLGAGKTTLLLRWLSEAPSTGRRLGVVMNEFGAESVDSQLILRPGLPLQQVSGGCLCCASDSELAHAVQRLVQEGRCDYLVVETSGLADPDNVIDQLTDEDLLPQVRLQSVVTVLDADWYAHSTGGQAERVLCRKQLQYADVICLSKCDRVDEATREFVSGEVLKVNARARQIRLPYGLPEPGEILSETPAHLTLDPAPSSGESHLHSTYHSLTWRFPVPVDRSRFEAFLSGLEPREVVRAKGFVRFTSSPGTLHLFQTLWGHHLIEPFPNEPAPEPVAVLIGPHLDAEAYRERFRRLAFGTAAVIRPQSGV